MIPSESGNTLYSHIQASSLTPYALPENPARRSQWRLPLGRWRFRYGIYGREVVLHYCGLRREETYRWERRRSVSSGRSGSGLLKGRELPNETLQ